MDPALKERGESHLNTESNSGAGNTLLHVPPCTDDFCTS